jgi:hypothetical protein
MILPHPRGPVTRALTDALRRQDPARLPGADAITEPIDPLADEDLQLALWICYELHYQGFNDGPDEWEWQPELIAVRRLLEAALMTALRRDVAVPTDDRPIAVRLRELVEQDNGPQLSRHLQRHADRAQYDEFVIHRSLYQLKEADPYTWAIPRLAGRAKTALAEIQADEYGAGRPARLHSELYRKLMRGLGLDDAYCAYIDAVPAITLAIGNVMSLFGLHRQLRGALVGHLAAYEMTSSQPCRRYAKGLHRLGVHDSVGGFFNVHVTADALHEQLAAHDLCGGLAEIEPHLVGDIMFGAATCLHVDNRFAERVLRCWSENRSSLLDPAVQAGGVGALAVAT